MGDFGCHHIDLIRIYSTQTEILDTNNGCDLENFGMDLTGEEATLVVVLSGAQSLV